MINAVESKPTSFCRVQVATCRILGNVGEAELAGLVTVGTPSEVPELPRDCKIIPGSIFQEGVQVMRVT